MPNRDRRRDNEWVRGTDRHDKCFAHTSEGDGQVDVGLAHKEVERVCMSVCGCVCVELIEK